MSEHFHSLVSLLVHHAQQRPHAIALRHKKFGLWQQWSWQQLSQHTAQYAAALHTYGFQPKQTFLIISTPNVDIVALSLAVQAFGGVVQLLDHDVSSLSPSVLAHQLEVIAPEYVFIEQLEHLGDLAQLKHCPTFAFYLESNHLQEHAYEYIVSIDQLLLDGKDGSSIDLSQSYIQPSEDAFAFERIDQQQRLSVRYTHQELIEQAQQLTKTHQLDEHEDAFIARAFSSIGHIRYLWSSWLLAGFSLNIPESLDTRDQDRQTIAPTLVLGTQQTYARVRELILSKLPEQTSLLNRTGFVGDQAF